MTIDSLRHPRSARSGPHRTDCNAQQRVDELKVAIADARATVACLQGELNEAYATLYAAQDAEDATFPQATMQYVNGSGAIERSASVAVVGRTSSGQVIVRHHGAEFRFRKVGVTYVQLEKTNLFGHYVLIGVPE